MRIRVVTPTLGESPWLPETVAAVAALPIACEHVLVAPPAVAVRLQREFPGVAVVSEPGGGMYAAINAGLAAAGSDWEAFTYINDDDLLLAGFTTVAAEVAAREGQPVMAYGAVRLIDVRGRRRGRIPVSPQPALNRDLYAQRLEPVYQHGTLVSRSAWERVGGFDPAFRYCGDSEFLARLCLAGVPTVRVAGEVAAFRLRRGQLTKNRPAMRAERDRVDTQLGLLVRPLTWRHHWARWRFRTANLPAYVGRIARYGIVSFDNVLGREAGEA